MTEDTPEPEVSLSDLEVTLRKRMDELLHAARIWKMGSYGWKDADTEDPEYIGHVRWQTDPPVGDEYLIWNLDHRHNKVAPPPLTDRQQMLSVAGTDFEALMECAYLSLAMLLVQVAITRVEPFHDDTFLDHHRMSTIIYLATASERIREFFIAAVFGQQQRRYDRRGKYRGEERSHFTTPFTEAADRHGEMAELAEPLAKLGPYAEQVRQLRATRNDLIHKLATEMARRHRRWIDEPKVPNDDYMRIDYVAMREAANRQHRERMEGLDAVVAQLADGYELLIKTSNEVFIVERMLRPR